MPGRRAFGQRDAVGVQGVRRLSYAVGQGTAPSRPDARCIVWPKDRLAAYDLLKRKWEELQKVAVPALNAKLKAAGTTEVKVNPPTKPVRSAPSQGDDDEPASIEQHHRR